MQLLVIACVFSIDIFNVSSTLFRLSESLHGTWVCLCPSVHLSMHPVQQANGSPASPGVVPVLMGGPNQSPLLSMLWLAGVPAAPTPFSFSVLPPCITHSSNFLSSLSSHQSWLSLGSFFFSLAVFSAFSS